MSKKRKILYTALSLIFLLIMAESLCYFSLVLLKKKKNKFYDPVISSLTEKQVNIIKSHLTNNSDSFGAHHPLIGWTIRKNGITKDGLYKANSRGIRSDKEYPFMPRKDVIRLSAFGDSFTFGDEVSNENTWEEQLHIINSKLEVLNFGVSGYGLDQAYLRYTDDGILYNSHIVLIGFMAENIYRNVNIFRPFYWSVYENSIFTKPRFIITDDNLVLLKNPLPSLEDYRIFLKNNKAMLSQIGSNDYHYQIRYQEGSFDFLPSVKFTKVITYYYRKKFSTLAIEKSKLYNDKSEAFLVTVKIFDKFYQSVLDNASLPVIIIYPDVNDQYRYRRDKTKRYEPLIEYLKTNKYYYIDILAAFEKYEETYSVEDLAVGKWGHYSPLGNRIIAEYVDSFLKTNQLTTKVKIRKALNEKKIKF